MINENDNDKIYLNPILPGCYPDPGICRVNDDYYIVCSSFSYYPGLPVFHSKDLIHWRQIGHVLDRPSQLNLDNLPLSKGCYAPSIHYNNGTFYIANTFINDKLNNFIVTAEKPEGPWSDPFWIENTPGIDPSLFFDDNEKVYWISNGDSPSPRYKDHKIIWLQEIDIKSMELVPGTKHILADGGSKPDDNPIWIEGPHIFKENQYYYLIAAEGGTAEDHSEVVFRSKQVTGPYESFKGNPILTQRQLNPKRDNPVTCTGHADLVKTQSGDWWAVFLGCRPYEPVQDNYYNTGRETFMAPVTWLDGWPIINYGYKEIRYSYPAPNLTEHIRENNFPNGNYQIRDDFETDELALYWNFLRTPREKWYSLHEKKGYLRIRLRPAEITILENPGFIGRRQQHLHYQADASLLFTPMNENETAGITAFQNEKHFYYFGLTLADKNKIIRLVKGINSEFSEQPETKELVLAEKELSDFPPHEPVYLRIKGTGNKIGFFFSKDNKQWDTLGKYFDARYLSTKEAGGFVGAYIGLYASSKGTKSTNHADFDWFEYSGTDPVYQYP